MPGFEIIDKKEKKAVNSIFKEGGVLFAHGFERMRKKFHIREFEKMFCKKFKCKHSLAVSSGTAAIKIGLKALGVKPGDEVITQAFNFIATVEAIVDVGAKPIIVNVDDTLNMNVEDLKKAITPRTKVILPVHMLGVPANIGSIMKFAKAKKIKVLEDNCESVGARFNKKYLGTIGHIGVLSFDFGKVITTGEGGMILTNDSKLDKYSREYHDHGHENNPKLPRGKDTRSIYGFNYRMTELQGAIGKVQLSKLNYIVKNNKERYISLLKGIGNKFKLRTIPSKSQIIYDTFILFVENNHLRNKIVKYLQQNGFGTKNLPDAIAWHCAAYWDHVLEKKQTNIAMITKKKLGKAIAIPIWINKSPKDYLTLGKNLKKIK
tara:strand:- start:36480 stop:37610 length:1131 start_codon:yes stop_codon:yes gene_type:complete